MKKIISLFVLVLVLNFQALGQTAGRNENLTKGHYSFGLSSNTLVFSTSVYKNNHSKTSDTNINLDLNVGYFIIDQLKVGLYTKVKNISNNDKSFFSIGPGLTYYFTGKSNFIPYLLSSGGYYKTKSYSFHENGYTLDFGVGALFMINKYIGLNAHLLYDYKNGTRKLDLLYINDPNDPNYYSQISVNQSKLGFRIGFSIFL